MAHTASSAHVEINWHDETGTANKIPTQYASRFEVKALEQDGATVGRLAGIDIGADGKVVASYSNGRLNVFRASGYGAFFKLTRFTTSGQHRLESEYSVRRAYCR